MRGASVMRDRQKLTFQLTAFESEWQDLGVSPASSVVRAPLTQDEDVDGGAERSPSPGMTAADQSGPVPYKLALPVPAESENRGHAG